jgi:hypothetical protein
MSSTDELRTLGHDKKPILQAIREKCLDCSGGSRAEVKDCLVPKCALYPFRLGTNPWRLNLRRPSVRCAAATSPRSPNP